MQHNYTIDGYAFRLRPATMDDAQFIVALRKEQQFFNAGAKTVEEQKAWMQDYYAQSDSHYFIIEEKHSRRPVGTFRAITASHASKAKLESWAILPDSLASVESLLLMCRFIFTTLGLAAYEALTICENHAATSTYKSIGAKTVAKRTTSIRDKTYNCEILELTAQEWEKHSSMLKELSMRIAQKINSQKQCN